MAKEKVKKVWDLLSKISFELDQIKKGIQRYRGLKGVDERHGYLYHLQCWRMERRRALPKFVKLRL